MSPDPKTPPSKPSDSRRIILRLADNNKKERIGCVHGLLTERNYTAISPVFNAETDVDGRFPEP
jgi:hypothetical protein